MARTKLTAIKADFNKITNFDTKVATTVEEGFEFIFPETDELCFIVVTNNGGASGTIAVKAPEQGSYASTDEDLVETIEAGKSAIIRVETARFANTDGSVVLVPSSADVEVAVIC